MAVRMLFADQPPDLILSGVNSGQNLAEDVTYSGTIAGAMEGTILGVPSIALSQVYDFLQVVRLSSGDVLKVMVEMLLKNTRCWNSKKCFDQYKLSQLSA